MSSKCPTPSRTRLTEDQIAQIEFAKASDGTNDDWVELYREEFPREEQRDVDQLRGYIKSGEVVLHETRDKDGTLLTWSMSQHYPAPPGSDEPSFWLGCWTVTRRSSQSTGIGRLHFAKVVEALKVAYPTYIGRVTEIESTRGQDKDSQPVRRARFYQALNLREFDIDYDIPLFQPPGSDVYVEQAKLGTAINGQLLIASFDDKPVSGKMLRSIVRRIYRSGYQVSETDPYMAEQLALIDAEREDFRTAIRILAKE